MNDTSEQDFIDDIKGKSEIRRLREVNAELLDLCNRQMEYIYLTGDSWAARELKKEASKIFQKARGEMLAGLPVKYDKSLQPGTVELREEQE